MLLSPFHSLLIFFSHAFAPSFPPLQSCSNVSFPPPPFHSCSTANRNQKLLNHRTQRRFPNSSSLKFIEICRCVQIQEKKNCDDPQEQRKPEDLRIPFERFGPVKDVYLPKNYYTGEPRGFGFVKYRFGEDAVEAKQQLNHTVIGGRELRIVFAEENRKTPQEMRTTARVSSRHGGSSRRRTPPRSPRRQYCCRF
ncbi:serine/arginine-rich SC35-like splicing factor SCL28 [Malus sylvestris]|uniref:serine/arginine-rich SC35-like splicing factor SCL28 n=1 Tax=Malus sylvestris TaxID=3752 RepID=UPI0021AC16D4|nr:serine/arginine-rich SC35-like splicing factor SCL28 [Malus sylvestris]XP_050161073.1 serine/arginine-rich SC35-like splicing factor SCL28 [Malus sylvestris]